MVTAGGWMSNLSDKPTNLLITQLLIIVIGAGIFKTPSN